ncbi:hypothetical protein GIB67_038648 [Kingdonia uniflora]|uniref:Uncharacterized protein n=1 Tax=Kingdonia uniflora TaxID=39325 RepID=A0A7J7NPN3_9MAGN|nr:hypothetical protein GIB67_038648 [Kingdonia uniflora]
MNQPELHHDTAVSIVYDTGIWTKVLAIGEGPSARFSVAGDCLDAWKGVLVFIGGCNQHLEALEDMYYLHTDITMENGQDEQRPEKLSIRKELKRKCQEQYLPMTLSLQDKGVAKLGVMPDICKATPLSCYGQAEDKKDSTLYELKPSQEKIFEAKVTEAFHYGYTIETNIGGKPLRGILFSYKPSFANATNSYLSRKSIGEEVSGVQLDEKCKPIIESARPLEEEVGDYRQTDETHEKESTSQDSPVETTHASSSTSSTPVDNSLHHMVSQFLPI